MRIRRKALLAAGSALVVSAFHWPSAVHAAVLEDTASQTFLVGSNGTYGNCTYVGTSRYETVRTPSGTKHVLSARTEVLDSWRCLEFTYGLTVVLRWDGGSVRGDRNDHGSPVTVSKTLTESPGSVECGPPGGGRL